MAWGDDDTGFGDSFGDAFGEGYGEDQGAYSGESYGESVGGYGDIDASNMGEALGYDTGSLGDLSGYLSPEDYSFNPSELFDKPTLANLESYYSTPTQIGYSAPTSTLAGTFGYMPGTQQEMSPELAAARALRTTPADVTGMSWDQARQTEAELQNIAPTASWDPKIVQAGLTSQYETNPLTKLARFAQTAGTYGSLVNPAVGFLGPIGSLADYGLRSYYGQPRTATGIGGTVGSALGGFAGPAGSVLGKSIGESAVAGLEGRPAGETFGKSFGTGVAGMLGSLAGGAVAGPAGARVGSMTLGDLAKTAMAINAGRQAMRAQREGQRGLEDLLTERTRYASQLANLPQTFQSSPVFKSMQEQALRTGIRGLAAQGKLGSGARAYAMGKVASDIANQYYNQEANRLANLAGTPAQNMALQRAVNQARGARTDLRTSILADLLQRYG